MKEVLKKNRSLLIGIVAVFFLSLLFPYTGDDLQWSLTELSWNSFWALTKSPMVNGRYLGNLFVIVMTKNIFVRGIIISLVLGGIVYLIKKETEAPYILIWAMLILMPVAVWTQSIVWTSGFTNYVISTLFLLGILLLLRRNYLSKPNFLSIMSNFALVFLGSFFIENMTVFLVIVTSILNVVYFIKHKEINVALLGTLLASVLGTVLMFIQPAYHNVFTGEDTYRSFGNGIGGLIIRCFANYVFWVHRFTAFENVALITSITVLLAYYYHKNKSTYQRIQKQVLSLSFYVSFAFIIYIFLSRINLEWSQGLEHMKYVNATITSFYFITLFTQIILLFRNKKCFGKILIPLIVIVGLLAPLAIVSPIGPRNFFMIYVFEMVEVFYILKETGIDWERYKKYVSILLSIVFIYYVSIYSYMSSVSVRRDHYVQYIANETDASLVYVPILPYSNYAHYSTYSDGYTSTNYKEYLGVRQDLELIFIEYDEWKLMLDKR